MKLKELLLLTSKQKYDGFFIRGNEYCGEWKEYYGTGLYTHCFYLKGKRNGAYKRYYANGKLSRYYFYLHGKAHGE